MKWNFVFEDRNRATGTTVTISTPKTKYIADEDLMYLMVPPGSKTMYLDFQTEDNIKYILLYRETKGRDLFVAKIAMSRAGRPYVKQRAKPRSDSL